MFNCAFTVACCEMINQRPCDVPSSGSSTSQHYYPVNDGGNRHLINEDRDVILAGVFCFY